MKVVEYEEHLKAIEKTKKEERKKYIEKFENMIECAIELSFNHRFLLSELQKLKEGEK